MTEEKNNNLAAVPQDPYTTTIDWKLFVVETADGQRGISLRQLVEVGGLYEHMSHAVKALNDSGFSFDAFASKPPGSQGGRPSNDYLMDLRTASAQEFRLLWVKRSWI